MSIVSGDISAVSNVKILVARVYQSKIIDATDSYGRKRRFKKPIGEPLQLTIISNKIELSRNPIDEFGKDSAVMILPVPLKKSRNRISIINLDNYECIFQDFSMLFSKHQLFERCIGNYHTFLASNIDTLKNQHKVVISQDVIEQLEKYYGKGYAFILCVLKVGTTYHPLAYVHELRDDGRLFIPTRRFHGRCSESPFLTDNKFSMYRDWKTSNETNLDDHYHDTLMLEDRIMQHQIKRRDVKLNNTEIQNDWNHEIYIINHPQAITKKNKNGFQVQVPKLDKLKNINKYIPMQNFPKQITFGGIKAVIRYKIDSKYTGNHDIFI